MPKGQRTDSATRALILDLAERGVAQEAIAQEVGLAVRTVRRVIGGGSATPAKVKGRDLRDSRSAQDEWLALNPEPRWRVGDLYPEWARERWQDGTLTPEEAAELAETVPEIRCLVILELFCDTFFPTEALSSFQRQLARDVYGVSSPSETLVLGPPRHGKSFILAILSTVWELAGGGHRPEYYANPDNPLRDAEVILLSETEGQAQEKSRAITARLTENQALIQAYGRFRDPEQPWQESQGNLIVAGRRRAHLSGDWSLCSIGIGGRPLGKGAWRIKVDDAASLHNCRTPEQAEAQTSYLSTQIFSRLDLALDDTRLIVNGHRLRVPRDLYACLEQMTSVDEWAEDEAAEPTQLFQVLVYPVVAQDAEGRLAPLWPREEVAGRKRGFTAAMLARAKALAQDAWEPTWLQRPYKGPSAYCLPEWIYGTPPWPGILDEDRGVGESRPDIADVAIRLVSVDPAPDGQAAMFLADLLPHKEYSPVLLDVYTGALPTHVFLHMLEDWWARFEFQMLIVEANMAGYLLGDHSFQAFLKRTGVRLIPHKTSFNKTDQLYGETSIPDDIKAGRIRVPWGTPEARARFSPLIDELLEVSKTRDHRMALWFPKWHLGGLVSLGLARGHKRAPARPPIPPPPRMRPVEHRAKPRKQRAKTLMERAGLP